MERLSLLPFIESASINVNQESHLLLAMYKLINEQHSYGLNEVQSLITISIIGFTL